MKKECKAINHLPVAMIVLFAGFWSTFGIIQGMWLSTIPSAVVLALTASRLIRGVDDGGVDDEKREG